MNKTIALIGQALLLPVAKVISWALTRLGRELEYEMANGPKEQAALDALDDAIDAVQEWKDDEDERDAAQIAERTSRISALLPRPTQGQATDVLTGLPVDASQPSAPGPASPVLTPDPVVTPEESGQAPTVENPAPAGEVGGTLSSNEPQPPSTGSDA